MESRISESSSGQLLTFSLFVAFEICLETLEKLACFFFMFSMGEMHKKLCVVMDEGRRFFFRALRIKAAVQLVTKPPSPPGLLCVWAIRPFGKIIQIPLRPRRPISVNLAP